MKLIVLTAAALTSATLAFAQGHIRSAASPAPAVTPPIAAATARDAEDFIAKVEGDLAVEDEYANRVSWIAATFITKWLAATVSAERGILAVARAKRAATFDNVRVDPVTRRKLEILKRALSLPAPDRAGASEEMAKIKVELKTLYSTGKVAYQGKLLALEEIEELMRSSRDPAELKALWERWHAIARPMRNGYGVSLASRTKERANSDIRRQGCYGAPGMTCRPTNLPEPSSICGPNLNRCTGISSVTHARG